MESRISLVLAGAMRAPAGASGMGSADTGRDGRWSGEDWRGSGDTIRSNYRSRSRPQRGATPGAEGGGAAVRLTGPASRARLLPAHVRVPREAIMPEPKPAPEPGPALGEERRGCERFPPGPP